MGHQEWKRIASRRSYAIGFEIDGPCTALLGRCETATPLGHLGQQRHPEMYGKQNRHFSACRDVPPLFFWKRDPKLHTDSTFLHLF